MTFQNKGGGLPFGEKKNQTFYKPIKNYFNEPCHWTQKVLTHIYQLECHWIPKSLNNNPIYFTSRAWNACLENMIYCDGNPNGYPNLKFECHHKILHFGVGACTLFAPLVPSCKFLWFVSLQFSFLETPPFFVVIYHACFLLWKLPYPLWVFLWPMVFFSFKVWNDVKTCRCLHVNEF